MTLTDEQYITAVGTLFSDEETVRMYSARVVRVMSVRQCMCPRCDGIHVIEKDTRAVVEEAIISNKWRNSYVCLPCLENWYHRGKCGQRWFKKEGVGKELDVKG